MTRRYRARAFPIDVTLLAEANIAGEGLMGTNILQPLAPEGERFPGMLETVDPDDFPRTLEARGIKNEWYHGTTGSAARNIIETGSFKPMKHGRTQLAPISDRVYLSNSLDEGLKHAVFRGRWGFGRPEEDGGLVRVGLKDPSLLWPDEDEIGRIIAEGYLHKIGRNSGLNPEELILFDEIWPNLSFDFKEKLERIPKFRLDEVAYEAMLGKRALKWLSMYRKDFLLNIIDHFNKVSTPYDNVIVEEVWIFKRTEFPNIKDHWSPELKTLMERSERIKAHGIGRGWHYQSARHALAARGVRMR